MDITCGHFPLNHTEFQEEGFWSDFSESTFGVCLLPFILAEAQSWEEFGLVEKKSDYGQRIFKTLGNAFLSIDLEFLHALELGIGLECNVVGCWQAFASICKSRLGSFWEWEEMSRLWVRFYFLCPFLLSFFIRSFSLTFKMHLILIYFYPCRASWCHLAWFTLFRPMS